MNSFACLAVVMLTPSLALAQDDRAEATPPPGPNLTGVMFGVGVGYGAPFGDVISSTSLNDGIRGEVPLSLNLDFRLVPNASFGLAFQYAPLLTKNCVPGGSCSASDARIGIEVRLHAVSQQKSSPWVSFGLGYEWLSLSESASILGATEFSGFEFSVEAGEDIRVAQFLTLGPYLGMSVGRYGSASDAEIPSDSQLVHGWLACGLRGTITMSKP